MHQIDGDYKQVRPYHSRVPQRAGLTEKPPKIRYVQMRQWQREIDNYTWGKGLTRKCAPAQNAPKRTSSIQEATMDCCDVIMQ